MWPKSITTVIEYIRFGENQLLITIELLKWGDQMRKSIQIIFIFWLTHYLFFECISRGMGFTFFIAVYGKCYYKISIYTCVISYVFRKTLKKSNVQSPLDFTAFHTVNICFFFLNWTGENAEISAFRRPHNIIVLKKKTLKCKKNLKNAFKKVIFFDSLILNYILFDQYHPNRIVWFFDHIHSATFSFG